MPKIKLTKTELKTQRDSLKQFQRFLPTLQLKKQQLQMEMRNCQQRLRENEEKEKTLRDNLNSWVALLGEGTSIEHIINIISLEEIVSEQHNIAGVQVPIFKSASFKIEKYDIFREELWIDFAISTIKELIELKAEHDIIKEQYRLIGLELRTTTQRVNLFEKVKIPECKENIRVIRIYLGDMDTAAVGRSKIAKRKMQETAA